MEKSAEIKLIIISDNLGNLIDRIGLFYTILCKQMKYFGTDNKMLTPYTTPHIIYIGGITNVKMG